MLFPIALGAAFATIFGKKDREGYGRPASSFLRWLFLVIIGVVVAANGPKLFVASSLVAIPVVIPQPGAATRWASASKLMYKHLPEGLPLRTA